MEIVNNKEARHLLRRLNRSADIKPDVLRARLMDYLKDHLNCEGFEEESREDKTELENSLQVLCDEFQRVALYDNNIRRIGRKNAFIDYIQGLPGNITVQFEYFKMYEDIAKLFNMEVKQLHNLDTDVIANLYYFLVERAVNDLLNVHSMLTLGELEIIN